MSFYVRYLPFFQSTRTTSASRVAHYFFADLFRSWRLRIAAPWRAELPTLVQFDVSHRQDFKLEAPSRLCRRGVVDHGFDCFNSDRSFACFVVHGSPPYLLFQKRIWCAQSL